MSFRKFTASGLALNLFVIVWGAFVRATGSGAGCGSHWPLCNGEVIPELAKLHTVIEFTHRATSGLSLIFAATLYFWARKIYSRGELARKAAGWTLTFTLTEALVGAVIVLFEWVALDRSVARAISISLHLVNTLLLVASVTLTWIWAGKDTKSPTGWDRKLLPWVLGSAAIFAALGMSGALTALGDTIFQSASLAEGIARDFHPGSHFLVKLRVVHPFLAVGAAVVFFIFAETCQRLSPGAAVEKRARWLQAAVGLQVLVGAANLGFMAPIALQLTHLFLANLAWIAFVFLSAAVLRPEEDYLKSSAGSGLLATMSSIR